jgi:hypothetical protein
MLNELQKEETKKKLENQQEAKPNSLEGVRTRIVDHIHFSN